MPEHSDDVLLQRVHALMPGLVVEQVERNTEGLINDVVVINQHWVFRFAKNDEYARRLDHELNILDTIRPHLQLNLPTPVVRGWGYMVYPFLTGQPLSRKTVLALDEPAQQTLAAQIGAFLHGLHTVSLPEAASTWPTSRAPVTERQWRDIKQRVENKIYPLLQKYQVEWAEDVFNSVLLHPEVAQYTPVLIHGDLASYHLLFEPTPPTLTGVLDFGMAGLGDAASDIGNLISIYGETFVRKMEATYPALAHYLPRARFYAQLIELEWTLLGLETGETFWFTAHLAGARDIYA